MLTVEKCSDLYMSIKRMKVRCKFKYSKTNNREYLNLADEIESLLESLKWTHIDDVDFDKLEVKRNDLYFKIKCIDNN